MNPHVSDDLAGTDTSTLVTLPIDAIQCFAKDPRQTPNPEYSRIKDSIQTQGVDQPLVITQRPDTEGYLVAAGGNTRLKILRELFKETGDLKFSRVTAVIKPWRGESEVMLAHLRENDLRGDLIFFEKACAVRALRQLFEQQYEIKKITQTEFVAYLHQRGYALSQSSLSYMDYVVDFLAPLLPMALRGGIGRNEVVRIRAVERTTRALWNDRVQSDPDGFDDPFAQLCARYDGPDWDLLSLRQALEAEIADRLNQTVHAIRLALDTRLAGSIETALPCLDEVDNEWPEVEAPQSRVAMQSHQGSSETALKVEAGAPHTDVPALSPIVPNGPVLFRGEGEAGTRGVTELRAEAAQLATALAGRYDLSSLIVPTDNLGTGFLVVDVPDPGLLEPLDESALALTSTIWWQLVACAEMTVAPVACLLPHLSPACTLYRALERQDAELLFNAVWTLDPGQVGFRLWRALSEQAWAELRALMDCYRTLHQVAELSGISLWSH